MSWNPTIKTFFKNIKVQIENLLTWIFRQTAVQSVADGPIITIGKEFPKLCLTLFL